MSEPTQSPGQQPPPLGRFQFTLRQLLIVMTVWACGCAVAVQFGVVAAIAYVALGVTAVALLFRKTRGATALGILLLLFLLVFTTAPYARLGALTEQCTSNLKIIGLGLHSYHERYGCFPPTYTTDDSGRPVHSWRVLTLPFVEEQPLYEAYTFDEPWDGPNNGKLLAREVRLFSCPSESAGQKKPLTTTGYTAVVGPDTAWPGNRALRLSDITDGAANTIMVVEVANSGIHWMEPRDLHVVQMAPRINPKAGQGISSQHAGGANAAFADGSVRLISESISPEVLRALLTRAGGEKVDPGGF